MAAIHRLGLVRYDALEHIHRDRHALATYNAHYSRKVPLRVTTAAQRHPRHSELSADEALFV